MSLEDKGYLQMPLSLEDILEDIFIYNYISQSINDILKDVLKMISCHIFKYLGYA